MYPDTYTYVGFILAFASSTHCALVETMGTQTDKQKSNNKPIREIICIYMYV
jgi:hypothetical protein